MDKKDFFGIELCERFVRDNNLPIPVLNDRDKFFYYVNLYEDSLGTKTLYEDMCDEIVNDFNGDANLFLTHYYQVRDNMINGILNCPKYKDFLDADMKAFGICDKLKNTLRGNVYNSDNIGKYFLSIDLHKANFQALKFFDETLVQNTNSYDDYVKHYTKSEYIRNSKYTRQVVFGNCNPSRQITIEKHLVSLFYENFEYSDDILKLVRFNNDEIVFEIIDDISEQLLMNGICKTIRNAVWKSGVYVTYSVYKLEAMCLHSEKKNEDRKLNFVLYDLIQEKYKFKDVPQTYYAITHKLFNNIPLQKEDYYFRYEGLDAYIDDTFTLKYFKDKKEIQDGKM
jgi:hypothetical protein